jgi:hypothetical protein
LITPADRHRLFLYAEQRQQGGCSPFGAVLAAAPNKTAVSANSFARGPIMRPIAIVSERAMSGLLDAGPS